VTVIAIGGDHVIVRAHQGAAAYGDSFLADVQVEKTADLFRLVRTQAAFFKAPNAHHLTVELDLLFDAQGAVDRGARGGSGGRARTFFLFNGGSRLFAHDGRLVSCKKVKSPSATLEIK